MRTVRLSILATLLLGGCATARGHRRIADVDVFTFRRDWANAHLVSGPDGAFLFDAGLMANAEALEADIRSVGQDPSQLRAIILSHGHADHAGGARYFRERYGVPIIAGRGDYGILAAGRNDTLCPTGDEARGRLASDQAATYAPTDADVWIEDPSDLASLTGVAGRIVPLAGHTEGSLVVVLDDMALVGDLFRGTVFTSGAELHFYMCDLEDNRSDIRSLLEDLAPHAQTFFVGHFGPLDRTAVEARFPAR